MPAWLAKACAAMLTEENLRQGLTTFYKLCSCSPEHASRQLKMHLGKTATEFINDLRCRRAARHLDMTSLSIQEIAHDCGYGSLSHFYHSFNQRYHVSPKKYRRLQHSSTIS
jgi:AraC family cel operon transcriptional repressor